MNAGQCPGWWIYSLLSAPRRIYSVCHLFQFSIMFLSSLTWNNNLEVFLSFQVWSSLFYHNVQERPMKVAVLQEMWSSWSFLPGRTLVLMTSPWLLNLECQFFWNDMCFFGGLLTDISYVFIIFLYSKGREAFKKVEEHVCVVIIKNVFCTYRKEHVSILCWTNGR